MRYVFRKLVVLPIRFYQLCISPFFPARCRFYPTCSAFAHEAVMVHGIVKGGFLVIHRLLRCHPWNDGGYDPVPAVKNSSHSTKS